MPTSNQLRVTWVRSAIGRHYRQKRTIEALGFKRLQQTRILPDHPAIRGMLKKIPHLISWETVKKEDTGV